MKFWNRVMGILGFWDELAQSLNYCHGEHNGEYHQISEYYLPALLNHPSAAFCLIVMLIFVGQYCNFQAKFQAKHWAVVTQHPSCLGSLIIIINKNNTWFCSFSIFIFKQTKLKMMCYVIPIYQRRQYQTFHTLVVPGWWRL